MRNKIDIWYTLNCAKVGDRTHLLSGGLIPN